MEQSDQALLVEFVERRTERAFAELVSRHVDMVYSAAVRLSGNCSYSADDITQQVFIELARQAPRLRNRVVLEPWLHTTTRFVAGRMRRAQARRQKREREYCAMKKSFVEPDEEVLWHDTAIVLDDLIGELNEEDRIALLLRFFKQHDFGFIGNALGLSYDAARMRVTRALERLSQALVRRGIRTSTATLTIMLGAHAISAAPPPLAMGIATAATAATAGGFATSTAALAIMTTKVKIGLATALVIGGVSTPLILQRREVNSMRQEVDMLRKQSRELAVFREQNQQLSNLLNEANSKTTLPPEQISELMKLRALVAQLRRDSAELAKLKSDATRESEYVKSALDWKARVEALQQRFKETPGQWIPQLQLLSEDDWFEVAKSARLDSDIGLARALGGARSHARANLAGLMSGALMKYIKSHDGHLPNDILDLNAYFNTPLDPSILQQYQLTRSGKLSDVPKDMWLIVERDPLQEGFDATFRVGYDRFGVEQQGPMEKALGRFYAANPGREPSHPTELLPYIQRSRER